MNFRVELFIVSTDHILVIYNIRIHWKLSFLVISMRFFVVRLLSKLLTILVSGCYNK